MNEFIISGDFGNTLRFIQRYDNPYEETFLITIKVGKLFYVTEGYTSLEELKKFQNELSNSLKDNKTKINFVMTFNGINLLFIPNGFGGYLIKGKINDQLPEDNDIKIAFSFVTDQTFLHQTLIEIDNLIKQLPSEN